MKTVGNKTVDKFGLQKELRSKPIPLDQKLEVLWNQELPVEDENFISRVVANLPSGMAPEEERVCDWTRILFVQLACSRLGTGIDISEGE